MSQLPPPLPIGNPEPDSPGLSPMALFNILASPGETLDSILAASKTPRHWILPWAISAIFGILFSLIAFSQPAIQQSIRDLQERELQKRVSAGKLKPEELEATRATIERIGSTPMKVVGCIGAVLGSFAMLAVQAAALWLFSWRVFGSETPFHKYMEIAGVCSLVPCLGILVNLCLVLITGNLQANLGPMLAIHDFDPSSHLHQVAVSANLMVLWHLILLSVGLQHATRTTLPKAAGSLFGLWFLTRVVAIASGAAASGM